MPAMTTRDGSPFTPQYLEAIDIETCIGCGRCYKVCRQGVLDLRAVDEDDAFVDPDDGDVERMVMTVAKKGACIGCRACNSVCTKNCQSFVDAELALAA